MTTRAAPALAVLAAVAAVLATACGGKESCPTAAAYPKAGQTPACSEPAPQQVQITMEMCEACSHTSPTCTAQLNDIANMNIFLDTRWEVCTDNSSCAAQACANPTCQFSVANGNYTVHVLSQSGTSTFQLTVSAGSASCTGQI